MLMHRSLSPETQIRLGYASAGFGEPGTASAIDTTVPLVCRTLQLTVSSCGLALPFTLGL